MKICFILFSLYLFLQWGYGCDRYCPRAPLPNWQLCASFRRIIRTTVLGNVFFLSFFFIEDSEPQNPDTQLCLNDELRCHKVQGPYSRCRYLFWSATKKKKEQRDPSGLRGMTYVLVCTIRHAGVGPHTRLADPQPFYLAWTLRRIIKWGRTTTDKQQLQPRKGTEMLDYLHPTFAFISSAASTVVPNI